MEYKCPTCGCSCGYDKHDAVKDSTLHQNPMKTHNLCLEGSAPLQYSSMSLSGTLTTSTQRTDAANGSTNEHSEACLAADVIQGCTLDVMYNKLNMETLPDGFVCNRISDKILLYKLDISGGLIAIECGIIVTSDFQVICSSYNEVLPVNIYEDLLSQEKYITSISQLLNLMSRLNNCKQGVISHRAESESMMTRDISDSTLSEDVTVVLHCVYSVDQLTCGNSDMKSVPLEPNLILLAPSTTAMCTTASVTAASQGGEKNLNKKLAHAAQTTGKSNFKGSDVCPDDSVNDSDCCPPSAVSDDEFYDLIVGRSASFQKVEEFSLLRPPQDSKQFRSLLNLDEILKNKSEQALESSQSHHDDNMLWINRERDEVESDNPGHDALLAILCSEEIKRRNHQDTIVSDHSPEVSSHYSEKTKDETLNQGNIPGGSQDHDIDMADQYTDQIERTTSHKDEVGSDSLSARRNILGNSQYPKNTEGKNPDDQVLTNVMSQCDTQDANQYQSVAVSKRTVHTRARPCVFCGIYQTNLMRHFLHKHRTEEDVVNAQSLPRPERIAAFHHLRKRGIFKHNELQMKLKVPAYERQYTRRDYDSTKEDTVICEKCTGFYSRKYFSCHKMSCIGESTTEPNFIPIDVLKVSVTQGAMSSQDVDYCDSPASPLYCSL